MSEAIEKAVEVADKLENRERLAEEASQRSEQVTAYPAIMYLESQRGCPYDCIMCTVPKTYGRTPSEMPDEIFERLNPYFKYLELLAIHGNGEALLSRNIERYIEIARDNDAFLHCNSTAFPLNNKLIDKLLEAKLDIRFSIHAGSKTSYRRIMNDDLDKVTGKIARLVEQSSLRGRKENTFWFSSIVMDENVEEMGEFVRLAYRTGVKEVRFMRLLPNSRTLLGTRRSKDETRFIHHEQSNSRVLRRFNELLPEVQDLADELGVTIGAGDMQHWSGAEAGAKDLINRISDKLLDKKPFPFNQIDGDCLVPWTGQVQIEQNGDVGLCCAIKHVIGNLYEQDFSEIWHNEQMTNLRQSFAQGKQPKLCGYCNGVDTDEYNIPVNLLIDQKRKAAK